MKKFQELRKENEVLKRFKKFWGLERKKIKNLVINLNKKICLKKWMLSQIKPCNFGIYKKERTI